MVEVPQEPVGHEQAPDGRPQHRSAALALTLVAIVLALLSLASFAGALEARSRNAEEARRAAEVCEAGDTDQRCVPEPVTPHVVRGALLAGGALLAQSSSRRMTSGGPRPAH